jgi:hypothetical protein
MQTHGHPAAFSEYQSTLVSGSKGLWNDLLSENCQPR